jgi:hypothetical protein
VVNAVLSGPTFSMLEPYWFDMVHVRQYQKQTVYVPFENTKQGQDNTHNMHVIRAAGVDLFIMTTICAMEVFSFALGLVVS